MKPGGARERIKGNPNHNQRRQTVRCEGRRRDGAAKEGGKPRANFFSKSHSAMHT